MSKSIARGLVGAGAILLAILLTGCTDSPSPTPSARAVPTPTMAPTQAPTATLIPAAAPTPTPTIAPTNTPTPEPTPATAALPLGVYLTLCAPTEQELPDDATYGDLSSELAAAADRFGALTPPAQLSEWHLLNIENFRTMQAVFDTYPKDDVIDLANLLLIAAAADELEGKLGEVAVRLPEDVLQRMIEAGCIDPDVAPYDYVNEFESATRIAIGEAVAIEFESPDDEGMFVFLGEPGAEYVFTLDWEGWIRLSDPSRPIMVLFDAAGQELARLEDDDSSQNKMMWQAVTGGDYYIAVGDGATFGSLTLTVTDGKATEQLERDDHGNSEGDATAIRVGADVRGALDYDDDIDFFRFQAERGQSYQIDVALGTLDDSIVDLYDTDWSFLDTNDDYGDTYASRLYWEAPSSGERYVLVGGAYTSSQGTYTLTVSLIIDDHANSEGGATAIRAGAGVRGVLDYDGDIDYFRFQAERGQSYQIDVAPGTLDDSIVNLYDVDWSFLDSNDDYETFASRLYWEAPSSGERYVAVEGYGTGTYTLTVSLIDDHGNDFESATRLVIGEAVSLELENDDDIDVLVFRARPGTVYVLTLDWEYYSFRESSTESPLLAVYSSNGQEHTRFMGYDFSRISVPSIDLQWQAVTGGDYYIVIGDGNTEGAGAFYVTGEEATEPIASPTPTPRPTTPASSFVSVSAGGSYTCGVRSNGSVACWGNPAHGKATPPTGSFVSVSAGGNHTCGVRSNGSAACWGGNWDGQSTPPTGSFAPVDAGLNHTCGVRSDGSVACWGENDDGQATPPAGSFISVSAGSFHTCGVRSNGAVACWGDNEDGRATPPAGSFVSVSAGGFHTCGVRSNGSVACWGNNAFGKSTPPAGSFVSVSAGSGHTCGVRSNGSVACWGGNAFGKSTPPVGSFVSVSAGRIHTCGVRSDGSVACWGSDDVGQATPPATPTAATNIAPTPKPFPERTHVILRVVQVTEDWVPFSDASGWTQAVLQKESDVLRYYEAAIWEETDSVHLYAFPNDYDGLFGLRRENVPDADVIAYREQHAISVHSDMPEAWGDRRSDFLRIAFEDFVSRLVELHPEADHHLMYSGHGGPGGALFAGQLKHDDADAFLATWTRLLGKPLGVIDMGGPCNKGAYEDLANFCRHASYYVASDLPNGGYTLDDWTWEKHQETDPETQYHRLLASNDTLEEALIERVELLRKNYEYSMKNQIRDQVEQANYVYSCARFNDFSEAFELFVDVTTIQAPFYDLYQLMLDYRAPPVLLDRFRDVFVHGVDNRDFFEWKVTANGMLSPTGG